MPDNLVSGIDIGSTKIATAIAIKSNEEEEMRIIGFNTTVSRGVKKGLIVDIDQVTAAVEESIEKAERMVGQKVNSAVTSVGGPHISSLNSHGVVAITNPQGEIEDDDVERVVEAARAISLSTTRQIIDVSAREFIVDGQEGIKNPIGMSGIRLEVDTHIITASLTNLKNVDRCLSDLGIDNDGFVFSGLASAEAVLTDTEKELGAVLVDIGGGKIDMCLYADGALSYSASIPIGAKHITNDIAVGLRISLESAEKIKLFLSRNLRGRRDDKRKAEDLDFSELNLPESLNDVSVKTVVDGIIGARLEEMYKLIAEEIEKSGFGQSVPSGLVVTGGGALTVGIVETGRKVVGLPLRVGTPSNVTGLLDEIIDPQYATTVGLILQGRKNIINQETGVKKFSKIVKDFSLGNSFNKIKDMIKQFIP